MYGDVLYALVESCLSKMLMADGSTRHHITPRTTVWCTTMRAVSKNMQHLTFTVLAELLMKEKDEFVSTHGKVQLWLHSHNLRACFGLTDKADKAVKKASWQHRSQIMYGSSHFSLTALVVAFDSGKLETGNGDTIVPIDWPYLSQSQADESKWQLHHTLIVRRQLADTAKRFAQIKEVLDDACGEPCDSIEKFEAKFCFARPFLFQMRDRIVDATSGRVLEPYDLYFKRIMTSPKHDMDKAVEAIRIAVDAHKSVMILMDRQSDLLKAWLLRVWNVDVSDDSSFGMREVAHFLFQSNTTADDRNQVELLVEKGRSSYANQLQPERFSIRRMMNFGLPPDVGQMESELCDKLRSLQDMLF